MSTNNSNHVHSGRDSTESRRTFMTSVAAGTVGAGLSLGFNAASYAKVKDANDRVRVAVVGLRGMGWGHVKGYAGLENVEVAALCDVDENILAQRNADLEEATGRRARTYTDIRRLLEAKDIDVVGIATPNHWHSLGGIWACQAGKDVYVEKPCSHNIFEGRKLVEAARRYNRIVQHGTQSRSSAGVREGIRKLREGVIGDVYMAKGLCYKWRNTIGHTPEEPAPDGVHYDLWLGPAPQRSYSRNRFHYNWHWHWDYGNGDIGNQGVHEMDMARWGLGVGLPAKVQSSGGHYMFDDDQETPNCQLATFEYPDQKKQLVFEVRHWITNHEAGLGKGESNEVGVLFLGSEGYMVMKGGQGYRTFLGRKREPGPTRKEGGNHFANFIQAVRSRRQEDLHADIEEGHLSSALCHLANMAYRAGRTLNFDPATETVRGDSEAGAMLTRDYRAPFVVPDRV
jgi:predicted dehydrogenase